MKPVKTKIMKKNIGIFLTILCFSNYLMAQLKVTSNGKVGIGTNTPEYQLDVKHSLRFKTWTGILFDGTGLCTSPVIYPESNWYMQLGKQDRKVGTIFSNVIHTDYCWVYTQSCSSSEVTKQKIKDPLKLIKQVYGYQYPIQDTLFSQLNNAPLPKDIITYGLDGAETSEVFPGLTITQNIKGKPIYSFNYDAFIPVLIEAIKYQDSIVQALCKELANLKMELKSGEANRASEPEVKIGPDSLKHSETLVNYFLLMKHQNSRDIGYLWQNKPNPFTESTQIDFYVNESIAQAMLLIYNSQGQVVMSRSIISRGEKSEIISASGLTPGIYTYVLMCDGILSDAKFMIISK